MSTRHADRQLRPEACSAFWERQAMPSAGGCRIDIQLSAVARSPVFRRIAAVPDLGVSTLSGCLLPTPLRRQALALQETRVVRLRKLVYGS
jgi:hypothetical protein